MLGARLPLLPGSAAAGPVAVLVRPESVQVTPDPAGDGRGAGHQLPRRAVPGAGAAGRTATLVLAQVSAAEAAALSPGTAVRIEVPPAPAFAVPA